MPHSQAPWGQSATPTSNFETIRNISNSEGTIIAKVVYAEGASQEENLANAALITAAPKLKQLLQEMCDSTINQNITQQKAQALLKNLNK